MCPIINELRKNKSIDLRVLSTGQHRDMLDSVLDFENIRIDYDFSLMKIGQTLTYLTVEILNRTEKMLEELLPDFVLVHGDTVTAFAGALAAFYKKIPVCHIEAGLRTYDKNNPYPEEFNRSAIARIASYHFAPTATNKENLIREGVDKSKIFVTGNTVIDALKKNLTEDYAHADLPNDDFIILTAHRRENIGNGMKQIFLAVGAVASLMKIKVIYPVHKNEKILPIAMNLFGNNDYVKMIAPLGVFDFHNFLARCKIVVTDSGGIQEEASYLGKPIIVTRKTTERKELFAKDTIKLVGNDSEAIFDEVKKLITDERYYALSSVKSDCFGDGYSAVKIAKIISQLPVS